jgi:hypothetical protein
MPKFWLLGVMALWANLHGGFTLGIALAAAFGLEAVLLAKGQAEKLGAARRWGLFLALAIVAGALTPQAMEGYFFTAKMLGMSYMLANINEWLSPNFQKFQFLELWLLLLIAVALTRGIRLSPARLAILLGLVHLALKHGRNVELLGLLSPLLLASALGAQWTSPAEAKGFAGKLDGFFMRHARPASRTAIVAMVVLLGGATYYAVHRGSIAPPARQHPVAAIEAVKQGGIEGPVFNTYMFGGYLIFSGIPVFIDGRADMYGDDFLKQFLEAYRHPQKGGLEKLLEKYHVTWTLMHADAPAVALLDQLPGWRRFYGDDTAIVHVRDAGSLTTP